MPGLRHYLQPNPLVLLKTGNDFEEIGGSRISFGTEHLMECLYVDAGLYGQVAHLKFFGILIFLQRR